MEALSSPVSVGKMGVGASAEGPAAALAGKDTNADANEDAAAFFSPTMGLDAVSSAGTSFLDLAFPMNEDFPRKSPQLRTILFQSSFGQMSTAHYIIYGDSLQLNALVEAL